MTTAVAVRTLPAHGTTARYQRGCRCRPCTTAIGRAVEKRRLDRLEGNPRKIPTGPVIEHLATLRAADMSWSQIAYAAGNMAHSTPREIYIGKFDTVLRTTADKLLAVKPHRPSIGHVPAIGAGRRLQGLYALAHPHARIVARCRCSSDFVENLLAGRHAVLSVELDDAIRRGCDSLSTTVGKSRKTLARARREGWPTVLAWDDIDDPNEVAPAPVVEEGPPVSRAARQALAEARAAEIEHLASFGISADDIALRTGLSVGYVRDQIDGSRAPGWREKASA